MRTMCLLQFGELIQPRVDCGNCHTQWRSNIQSIIMLCFGNAHCPKPHLTKVSRWKGQKYFQGHFTKFWIFGFNLNSLILDLQQLRIENISDRYASFIFQLYLEILQPIRFSIKQKCCLGQMTPDNTFPLDSQTYLSMQEQLYMVSSHLMTTRKRISENSERSLLHGLQLTT